MNHPNEERRAFAFLSPVSPDDEEIVGHGVRADELRLAAAAFPGTPVHELPIFNENRIAASADTGNLPQGNSPTMLVTPKVLEDLATGYNLSFSNGFKGPETFYASVAMVAHSRTSEQVYGWLGRFPRIREWLGERRIKQLEATGYRIKNRKFEVTIGVLRTDIEDDQAGVYTPLFQELGRESAEQPDRLLSELISRGFIDPCYDGQNFFDTEHPVVNESGGIETVSNMQDGDGPAWYLLDTSRAIKPFIYQERVPYTLSSLTAENTENVFIRDEYLYGVRGRSNAGFGLWELAFASRAPLNHANYEAARNAMTRLRGDGGGILGVRPDTLLAPIELEGDARRLLKVTTRGGGNGNEWADSVRMIVTPWLSENAAPAIIV